MCHLAEPGVGHSVGPNLHGVLGATIGKADGYPYSEALAQSDGHWTRQLLDAFIYAPQKAKPGTSMPFEGLKSDVERRDLLCFLEDLK